jgi:UDP-N-acetylglucosamine acyltransferase
MAFSHIAHDCKIGNNVVVCNGTLIAGHAEIEDKAFISGNAAIHQFVRIGKLAMIGGLSRVNQDVPPFMMVIGDSRVWSLNLVGLRRAGFSKEEIASIRNAFNVIYRSNLPIKTALERISRSENERVKELTVFILASKRGICGPKRNGLWEKLFLNYPCLVRTRIPARIAYRKRSFYRKHLGHDARGSYCKY